MNECNSKELHDNEEGAGEKPSCRKMQRNANEGVFKEMKGAETAGTCQETVREDMQRK